MSLPHQVKIVEVGPRDGLQNESQFVPTATKIELINRLSETGITQIEATSFVSPKWIPQLSDSRQVLAGITQKPGVGYSVLVPNEHGFNEALTAGVTEIAVFASPSETFSKHNTNSTIAESMERISEVTKLAKQHNIKVRGYLSCVLGCPYEGNVPVEAVAVMAETLFKLGCYEISLGDTIGIGTPPKIKRLVEVVCRHVPMKFLSVHFHDTFGQALVNIYAAMEAGISVIDSSVAGLGGCPYAKGATGNVATEDVVYMLQGLGIQTGIDLDKLVETATFISQALNRPLQSKVSIALSAKKMSEAV